VLWSPSGKATVLQDVGGQGVSSAYAINASGQSVGQSNTASDGADAVLWSPTGKPTMLQNVGLRLDVAYPVAINEAGWSVGEFDTPTGQGAVLWSPTGKATVLQGVGGQGSQALAINDAGWSVGWSFTAGSDVDAVLWSPSGKATDLGAAIDWNGNYPFGINNSGDIIGNGYYNGEFHGFLLTPVSASALSATPVPEPSTWMMLLAGFAGLGFAGYCRAKTGHATLAA
jgi:PEP-CTERM motif